MAKCRLTHSSLSRRFSLTIVAAAFFFISGLALAMPLASAQSSVAVSIPMGAGAGQSAAPGYAPATVTVVIGVNNTVVWTNNDSPSHHTVTAENYPPGASSFNSGDMAPGATYSYTFTVPGNYTYTCAYHNWMAGTVVVKGSSTTPAPEFPAASLAAILFAAIAVALVAAPRLRSTLEPSPK